jgi:hypothetical protein
LIIGHGDRSVTDAVVLGLEASFIAFTAIAMVHLMHVSLLLHRERYHPENGGIERVSSGYGIWGFVLLMSMFALLGSGIYKTLLRRIDPVAISIGAPGPPAIQEKETPPAREAGRSAKTPDFSLHSIPPQSAANQQAQAQTQSPSPQQVPPTTFLDRVVQKNRGLTPADRNRLSDVLYSADKYLKQCRALGYKVNSEFDQLNRDRQSGALAKNVSDHIKSLKDLDAEAWEQYHLLQKLQSDNQYFSDQTAYIFGDNPFNEGIGLPLNSVEMISRQLSDWSEIENRSAPNVLELEASFQTEHETRLRQFFDWVNISIQRITQMRQSLEPNGAVQPIPSVTVAPASGMFGSIAAVSNIGRLTLWLSQQKESVHLER